MILEAVLLCSGTFLFVYFTFDYIAKSLRPDGKIEFSNLHLVITGGSKGIGKALAIEALKSYARVTIVARNEADLVSAVNFIKEKYQQFADNIYFRVLDVTWEMNQINEAVDEIENHIGPIDVLINCAGYSFARLFSETEIDEFEKIYKCNALGTVKMTKSVVERMKSRQFGQIGIVSSIAGQFGLYGYSSYCMSKFALKGFAECLAFELKPDNIGITIVFPPDTDTEGYAKENIEKPQITHLISKEGGLFSAENVAERILNGINKRLFSVTIGRDGYFLNAISLGCAPINNGLSGVFQFFFSGITKLVFLTELCRFYNIVATHTNSTPGNEAND